MQANTWHLSLKRIRRQAAARMVYYYSVSLSWPSVCHLYIAKTFNVPLLPRHLFVVYIKLFVLSILKYLFGHEAIPNLLLQVFLFICCMSLYIIFFVSKREGGHGKPFPILHYLTSLNLHPPTGKIMFLTFAACVPCISHSLYPPCYVSVCQPLQEKDMATAHILCIIPCVKQEGREGGSIREHREGRAFSYLLLQNIHLS